MEPWMITDPMPTVAKSILASITSPLEELELEWMGYRREYMHIHTVVLTSNTPYPHKPLVCMCVQAVIIFNCLLFEPAIRTWEIGFL